MIALGIDVGTTNVSVTAVHLTEGRIVWSGSLPNRQMSLDEPYSYGQDPLVIEQSVRELLGRAPRGSSICVTGQVHGILYYDREGRAVSPLYTWLDRRGCEPIDGMTAQKLLQEQTDHLMPNGYGLLTHYANRLMGKVPEQAVGFTGILDYITSRLAGGSLKKSDPTCLATYGAYDPVTNTTDERVLREVLGTDAADWIVPAGRFEHAGLFEGSVPVSYSVGDNQAGFFGTVMDPEQSCHISIGTSGQISLFSPSSNCPPTMELRPYFTPGYLHVGATLCGGKAYEVLYRLISSILKAGGAPVTSGEAVFDLMKTAAAEIDEPSLQIRSTFNGTRRDPDIRGSIEQISLENFTLPELIRGTVDAVVRELDDYRRDLGELFSGVRQITATGSAVRKNHLFKDALERFFAMEVVPVPFDDGAAVGAALNGAISAGLMPLDQRRSVLERMIQEHA